MYAILFLIAFSSHMLYILTVINGQYIILYTIMFMTVSDVDCVMRVKWNIIYKKILVLISCHKILKCHLFHGSRCLNFKHARGMLKK